MQCSKCGRPAFKYKIRTGGEEREVVLCPDCYRALYARAGGRRCPACGMTFEDYKRTGLLGCAKCYRYFRRELVPALKELQGGTQHTGKTPGKDAGENYELLLERARLRSRLEEAVRRGDDVEVERLGGQIRELSAAIRGVRA